jgi:hypothetical protein
MKTKTNPRQATRNVAFLMALSIGATWLIVSAPASAASRVEAPHVSGEFWKLPANS